MERFGIAVLGFCQGYVFPICIVASTTIGPWLAGRWRPKPLRVTSIVNILVLSIVFLMLESIIGMFVITELGPASGLARWWSGGFVFGLLLYGYLPSIEGRKHPKGIRGDVQ